MKINFEVELHTRRCGCGVYFASEESYRIRCLSCVNSELDEAWKKVRENREHHARVERGLRQYIERLKREKKGGAK